MKRINSIIQEKKLKQNSSDEGICIELLLRRGTITLIYPPRIASEMICQDCGGNNGHTWLENGKKLWFCGDNQCLKIDAGITKRREQWIWWRKHQLALKKSEEQKAKKKWDGK